MRKPYFSYDEIPQLMREYMLTVANEKYIMDIPLEDINSYLNGLHDHYKMEQEEEMDGWVQ